MNKISIDNIYILISKKQTKIKKHLSKLTTCNDDDDYDNN